MLSPRFIPESVFYTDRAHRLIFGKGDAKRRNSEIANTTK